MCCIRKMNACQARPCVTMCTAQKPCGHVTLNVVRPCVLTKDDNNMSCATSCDCVCFPRVMNGMPRTMSSKSLCSQGPWVHSTPDIVQPYVNSKGDNATPRSTLFIHVCFPNDDITRPTSYDSQCCPREMIACHARHSLIVCAA